MSQPDYEALLKQIDDIDTNFAIHERLSMDEVEKLNDILYDLTPYLQSGSDETLASALEVVLKVDKLLKKAGMSEPDTEDEFDTTTCGLCGKKYTGTDEELKNWEANHLLTTHPEILK